MGGDLGSVYLYLYIFLRCRIILGQAGEGIILSQCQMDCVCAVFRFEQTNWEKKAVFCYYSVWSCTKQWFLEMKASSLPERQTHSHTHTPTHTHTHTNTQLRCTRYIGQLACEDRNVYPVVLPRVFGVRLGRPRFPEQKTTCMRNAPAFCSL